MNTASAQVDALVLAGGRSSRMGGADKLAREVAPGLSLLRHAALQALAAGFREVIVVLPVPDRGRATLLEGLALRVVAAPQAAEGMAGSLRAGIAALRPGAAGLLVHLADMPDIGTRDLAALRRAFDGDPATILRAGTADGRPGNPVLFGAAHFGALAQLAGDTGARALLATSPVTLIPLPGHRALTDLDTEEDWRAWQDGGTPP